MKEENIRNHIDTLISRYGWMVMSVGGGAGEMGYAYTIGLTRQYAHPEVLVFGLPFQVAHGILGSLVTCIEAEGRPLPLRRPLREVASAPVQLIPILRAYRTGAYSFFNGARAYYGTNIVEAVQLVWPDTAGRFPWMPGFNEMSRVPLLDEPGLSHYRND